MISKKDQQIKLMIDAAGKYHKKTVLITGSSGFIGSSLARAFFNIDCCLILVDINNQIDVPRNIIASIKFIKADITKKSIWEDLLKGVDFIFHLAGLEYNRLDFDIYKDLNINALAVINLLETCRINNYQPKIIFSSSANLFGQTTSFLVNEKTDSMPLSLWSAHKLLAENYLKIYAAKYGIRAIILRLANVYGPAYNKKVSDNVVINKAITNALAGNNLCLYHNRNCRRNYLYIDDAVRAFLLAGSCKMTLPDYGYYVIGSPEALTIAETWEIIATQAAKKSKRKARIKINRKIKLEPFDYRNFIIDSALFSKTTGWIPLISLRSGIKSTVASMFTLENNYGSRE